MSGNGTLIQVHVKTPVMDFLTGCEGDAQLTFFRSESACYATFATNWVRLNFQATTLQSSATETLTTADVPRAGDMLCHTYLVINAPAIVNVTATDIDLYGGSVENLGATSANVATRMFVQTGDNETRFSALSYTDITIGYATTSPVVVGSYRYMITIPDKTIGSIIDTSTTMQVQDSAGKTRILTIGDIADLIASPNDTVLYSAETFIAANDAAAAAASGLVNDDLGTVLLQGTSDAYFSNAASARFLDMRYQNALVAVRQRNAGPSGAVPVTATGLRPMGPILDRNSVHANYGNYAPCTLVNSLECVIGENAVSRVTGLVMQANCELWISSDKLSRRAVNKSADPTERGAWALKRQTWVVPVPFWFTQGYHSSLPMCALSFHTITFNLHLNPYTRCILNGCDNDFSGSIITVQGAHGSTTLTTVVGPSSLPAGSSAVDIIDSTSGVPAAPANVLSGSSFTFYMLLELIYLSDDERDTYSDMTDEVLVLQYQYASVQTLSPTSPTVELSMRFNHPVSHLVVCGQLQSHLNDNRYGDFEGPSNMFSISDKYPEGQRNHWLKSMQIHFNNNARTLEMPWWFFHETMPQVSAERIPDSHFYLYSFGLGSPNGSGQFHGGADFSRLDSAIITINANPHVFSDMSSVGGLDASNATKGPLAISGGEKIFVHCFAVSGNIAKFDNGLLGVCFL
jgi:hypothetical protein